jgi:ubiquinone/menaquinone biosynthesis C-methylase UbiE
VRCAELALPRSLRCQGTKGIDGVDRSRISTAVYKVQALARLGVRIQGEAAPMIVDFGGGMGPWARYLNQSFPSAHIVCVDVSARSLAVGRQHFARQASFVRFDGHRFPIADASVDLVFSACVFHHIEPV